MRLGVKRGLNSPIDKSGKSRKTDGSEARGESGSKEREQEKEQEKEKEKEQEPKQTDHKLTQCEHYADFSRSSEDLLLVVTRQPRIMREEEATRPPQCELRCPVNQEIAYLFEDYDSGHKVAFLWTEAVNQPTGVVAQGPNQNCWLFLTGTRWQRVSRSPSPSLVHGTLRSISGEDAEWSLLPTKEEMEKNKTKRNSSAKTEEKGKSKLKEEKRHKGRLFDVYGEEDWAWDTTLNSYVVTNPPKLGETVFIDVSVDFPTEYVEIPQAQGGSEVAEVAKVTYSRRTKRIKLFLDPAKVVQHVLVTVAEWQRYFDEPSSYFCCSSGIRVATQTDHVFYERGNGFVVCWPSLSQYLALPRDDPSYLEDFVYVEPQNPGKGERLRHLREIKLSPELHELREIRVWKQTTPDAGAKYLYPVGNLSKSWLGETSLETKAQTITELFEEKIKNLDETKLWDVSSLLSELHTSKMVVLPRLFQIAEGQKDDHDVKDEKDKLAIDLDKDKWKGVWRALLRLLNLYEPGPETGQLPRSLRWSDLYAERRVWERYRVFRNANEAQLAVWIGEMVRARRKPLHRGARTWIQVEQRQNRGGDEPDVHQTIASVERWHERKVIERFIERFGDPEAEIKLRLRQLEPRCEPSCEHLRRQRLAREEEKKEKEEKEGKEEEVEVALQYRNKTYMGWVAANVMSAKRIATTGLRSTDRIYQDLDRCISDFKEARAEGQSKQSPARMKAYKEEIAKADKKFYACLVAYTLGWTTTKRNLKALEAQRWDHSLPEIDSVLIVDNFISCSFTLQSPQLGYLVAIVEIT